MAAPLDLDILTWNTPAPGPRLLVFGGIHGDEVCGPRALRRVAAELNTGQLRLRRGRFTCVPVCNPEAARRGVRSIEENLNRVFTRHEQPASYEQGLANRLCDELDACDVFVDLHSMSADGDPFVLQDSSDPASLALGRSLGVETLFVGWPDVYRAHPEKQAQCTQTYAELRGIPNSLIECGRHTAPEAEDVAYRAVVNALRHCGLVDGAAPAMKQKTYRFERVYFREHEASTLARDWKNLDVVRAGELMAVENGREIRAPFDGYVVFPHVDARLGAEWFYLAK